MSDDTEHPKKTLQQLSYFCFRKHIFYRWVAGFTRFLFDVSFLAFLLDVSRILSALWSTLLGKIKKRRAMVSHSNSHTHHTTQQKHSPNYGLSVFYLLFLPSSSVNVSHQKKKPNGKEANTIWENFRLHFKWLVHDKKTFSDFSLNFLFTD